MNNSLEITEQILKNLRKSKLGIMKLLFRFAGIVLLGFSLITFVLLQFIIPAIGNHFKIEFIKTIFSPFLSGIISGFFVMASLFCLFISFRLSNEEKKIRFITHTVNAYRRIKLSDLAVKTGIPPHQVYALLIKALDMQIITGNFDRNTDEFYTDKSTEENIEIKFCQSCGASLDKIYYKGESFTCLRCGTVIS